MEKLSQDAYRTALEALPTGAYLVDLDRRIFLWSSGAEELTGYLPQEVVGRSCRDDLLMHCDANESCVCGVSCPLQQTMCDGKPRTAELVLLHKDGHGVPVKVRVVPLRNEDGTILGAVGCFDKRPVFPTSDPRLCELSRHASIDALTGLPDRSATETLLRAYLEGYETSHIPFGIAAIAVDNLELLHEKDGPNAVGAVLRTTGRTLAGSVGPQDMVGRWTEHRFLAVVTSCTTPALLMTADRMQKLVNFERIPWWGNRLSVTLSVGGTIVEAGDTVDDLVGRVEMALERSLQQSADNVVVI